MILHQLTGNQRGFRLVLKVMADAGKQNQMQLDEDQMKLVTALAERNFNAYYSVLKKWSEARRPKSSALRIFTDLATSVVPMTDAEFSRLYLPDGLWVDAERQVNGNRRTYIIHSAISTGQLGYLSIASTGGIGANHVVAIGDSANISALVKTSVHLKYYSQEGGNYRVRYDGVVPASALTAKANGVRIAMGGLGINLDFLKDQTNAYVGLTVTQALGTNSTAYSLGTYYTIAWAAAVGAAVKAKVDADLYSGSTVVGHVTRGDEFIVVANSGDWVSLKKPDDTPVRGWIRRSQLEGLEP